MSSRHSYPTDAQRHRTDGQRRLAFFVLMLLGVTIAFLMLANGAKTWFANSPRPPRRDAHARQAQHPSEATAHQPGVRPQTNLANQAADLEQERQRAQEFVNDSPSTNLPPVHSQAGNSQPRSMVTGHLTHQAPGDRGTSHAAGPNRLQLTMPQEFATEDRSPPSGDELVRDRNWRTQFQPTPPHEPAVAQTSLTEIRPYQEWDVHQTASDSLGRIGVAAVPSLIRALSNHDPKRRAEAAWLLGRIGPDASSAVDALVVALSDPETSVQKSAARALGQFGPDAAKAVDALMRVVQETDPVGVTGGPDAVSSQSGVVPQIRE